MRRPTVKKELVLLHVSQKLEFDSVLSLPNFFRLLNCFHKTIGNGI